MQRRLARSIPFLIPLQLCISCQQDPDPPHTPFVPAISREEILTLSNHPQLFLDDYVIKSIKNLRQELAEPVKHPWNPLIVQEHPWESRYVQVYGTILYDTEMDRFRMWYMASESAENTPEYTICYAESQDGIHWTKPFVGTAELPGYEKHNAVLADGHGLCVMKDLNETDPTRRYKGLGGEILAFSPDGIRWATETFHSAGGNDTSSSVVWWQGEYLAFIRNQEFWKDSIRDYVHAYFLDKPFVKGTIREVAFSKSVDFHTWTPKETVFASDPQDGYPWTQPYGMAVTAYGDVLIGLPWFIHLDRIKGNQKIGSQDVQLAVSRDGRTWKRVADRALLLESTYDSWDCGRIFPGTTMVVKDGLVYIYYTGSDTRHGEGWGRMGIGLATLPADRFLALRPAYSFNEGVLETKLLHFSGENLLINAEIGEGDLQVELVDANGRILKGFERNHSRLVKHDSLRYRVAWGTDNSSKTLRDVESHLPIGFRFYVVNCSLYAFQIEPFTPGRQTITHPNNICRNQTDYERDYALLTRAIEDDPDDISLYVKRGHAHTQVGNFHPAIADYSKVIEINPNDPKIYKLRGEAYFHVTEWQAAADDFGTAIDLDPQDVHAYHMLGIQYLLRDNFDDALEIFAEAQQLNPGDPCLYLDRGLAFIHQKEYDRAVEDLRKAIQLNSESGLPYYFLGLAYVPQEQYRRAIVCFTKSIELNPEYPFTYYSRSKMYYSTGNRQLALSDLTKAIALNPMEPELFNSRGWIYYHTGDLNRSLADFCQSLDLSSAKYDSAAADDSKDLQSSPSNNPYYGLACIYSRRYGTNSNEADRTKALEYLEKAIDAGFEDLERLRQDRKLKALRGDPRFKKLADWQAQETTQGGTKE